jgi:single-stranded-DNA-specific exonuclease
MTPFTPAPAAASPTDTTLIRGHFKRWRLAPPIAGSASLADAIDIDRFTAGLLIRRGITTPDAARQFLKPGWGDLHDPRLLPGAHDAAARLVQAVRLKQPIVIYGDYDVDGVTASAILFHTIKTAEPAAPVRCYVPHRIDEGYGLNAEAISRLIDDGAQLILSVDCGITAIEPAAIAKARGVDLIITDHHAMGPQLPDAAVLVHPQLPSTRPAYPFPDLCGAGVAYKIAWEFARQWCGSDRVSSQFRERLIELLSLAALGTIADVVPLVGENRTITLMGLHRIKHTSLTGLNALIDASQLRDEKIDSSHVGFVLGPRLNACGRMGHASDAVKLLTEAAGEEAVTIARMLNSANEDRRATERKIFETAKAMVIERGFNSPDCRAIVLSDDDWHAGVVGIVCSRLVEAFGRPTILLSTANGHAHGSGRSIDGYNLHEALTACGQHLEKFGGHAMAAGLTLAKERIEAFRLALCDHAAERLTVDDLVPSLHVEAEMRLGDLAGPVVEQMQRLAPFGRENPSPVFAVRAAVIRKIDVMGMHGKHLSMTIQQGQTMMRCVGWNMGHLKQELAVGVEVDVAGEPKLNHFNGRTTVEMQLIDFARR